MDEAAWQIGTIPLFRALFDNYDAVQRICNNVKAQTLLKDLTSNPLISQNVNNEDIPTSAEQGEEGAFLDAVMDSAIMQEAYNFLSQTSKSSK